MTSAIQCPFLYQTRTILRQHSRVHRIWRRSMASDSGSRPAKSDSNVSSAQENSEAPSFLQQKAMDVMARKSQSEPRSTVPKQEGVSLDDIWKLFDSSTSPPSIPQERDTTTTARNHADTDHQAILELFSSVPEQSQRHEYHEQEPNTTPWSATSFSPFSFSAPSSSQTTKSAAVAEIADYLSDQPEPTTAIQQDDLLVKTAQKMISDISASFDAALVSSPRPDHAIWCISEEKVFPLIKLLIPPRSPLSNHLPSASTSPPAPSPHQPTKPSSHPSIPPSLPLLSLLSRIYPTALLLTLRLLYTQTPTSPFISALLPHIKSLGPTSYVLGVNTYFYNLLLSVRWDVYSDFRGIDNLLGEMERNGVEFDAGTLAVLKTIGDEWAVGVHGREKDVERPVLKKGKSTAADGGFKLDYGPRGSDWWSRSEVVKGLDRIEEWKGVVRRKLEEKGLGEVMREGGDGNVKDQDGEDAYVVTL